MPSRRNFIAKTSLLALSMATADLALAGKSQPSLVHHVFIWLKNKESDDDRNKLISGMRTLGRVESVREMRIGTPAKTEARDVVDASYSVSLLLFFDDVAGQQTYQVHPVHLKFVEDFSYLWQKVIVYDSMDISVQ